MKATETNFLNFLRKPAQFIIPIYQRTYSWKPEQCEQLWEDIIHAATDETISGHFVGSIVYIEEGLHPHSSIPRLLVIDGQQRLATLILLLSALGRAIKKQGAEIGISQKKISNYYLFNIEEDGDLRYKLRLTQSDKDTMIRLLEEKELPDPVSKQIVENCQFFEEQINKTGIDLITLYRGIGKLIIVDIALDRERDNPQLIFESLNSTGLELSQADLIRNYVLMELEPKQQEELYNDYWYPMEQSFGQADYTTQFDRFMRDYLTVKTGSIPNIRAVYEAFKTHSQRGAYNSVQELVADIYQYSKYFVYMALEKEEDRELRGIFNNINILKMHVAYPLFLELYDDYFQERLSREDFVHILKLVESYVFRRSVCGIPTNSLNKTFATFSRELDKEHCLESFMAVLLLKDAYRRFPNDDEFMWELTVKDLYNFRSRNYWLRKLENHDQKELVNVEKCTIEHIMPQNENLSAEWRRELGDNWNEIHTKYLHTLGNLTLTMYNSEMSDHSFIEKRDMENGFAKSKISLNNELAEVERWNEEAIKKRAQALAKKATEVWQYPQLTTEVIEKYRTVKKGRGAKTYTMEDHSNLTGTMMELFEQLRKRILNLDASVTEDIFQQYIAYKTTTNFAHIVPKKSRLQLLLNINFDELHDPKRLCKDMTGKGHQGNGDVAMILSSSEQLDDAMVLVRQSFDKHIEDGDD
jgi:uncharacterized protein with ParB-like and HNH nuclease domain/predicted transport protein